jgi:hypothetical protein
LKLSYDDDALEQLLLPSCDDDALEQLLLPSCDDDALVQLSLPFYDALQPRISPIKVVRSVTEPVSWISVALNCKTFHLFGKYFEACRNFIYLTFYAFFYNPTAIFRSKLVRNY